MQIFIYLLYNIFRWTRFVGWIVGLIVSSDETSHSTAFHSKLLQFLVVRKSITSKKRRSNQSSIKNPHQILGFKEYRTLHSILKLDYLSTPWAILRVSASFGGKKAFVSKQMCFVKYMLSARSLCVSTQNWNLWLFSFQIPN